MKINKFDSFSTGSNIAEFTHMDESREDNGDLGSEFGNDIKEEMLSNFTATNGKMLDQDSGLMTNREPKSEPVSDEDNHETNNEENSNRESPVKVFENAPHDSSEEDSDFEQESHAGDTFTDMIGGQTSDNGVLTGEDLALSSAQQGINLKVNKEEIEEKSTNPNIWTLPEDRNVCTLEEIRRGQVINKTAPNECPVLGCGKKINEMRAEPSPGTIASGLRTHVLFVHYANRKVNKKRKLGWSNKRRNQTSPKKLMTQASSPSTSKQPDFDLDLNNGDLAASLNLIQKNIPTSRASPQAPASLMTKKSIAPQYSAKRSFPPMSSHQSLMQATGNSTPSVQQKTSKSIDAGANQKSLNQTTSSLFSILAGLTQQQTNQPQAPISRNVKTAQGTNTINISTQSPRNNQSSNQNRPVNSSLLSLLNEKISGNVASSLQNQLKKTLDQRGKTNTSNSTRNNVTAPSNALHYQSISNFNETNFNNSSLLNSLCTPNSDLQTSCDSPLYSFIESVALRSGSNIGSSGIAEVKKIIERFTTSLISSSQTIADHYLAPFGGEVPQQKPEISPSDVMLAYKMMHKSHGQP